MSMARVTRENIKVGMTIWSAFDDRPFDGYGWFKAKVTEVYDDHYLYDDVDNDIHNIWGDFDIEECSVAEFTTEEECLDFLKLGK